MQIARGMRGTRLIAYQCRTGVLRRRVWIDQQSPLALGLL